MHVRNTRDFWSGLLFTATGTLFAVFSQQYEMGTLSRMGPGWFPTALGLLLMGLGLAIVYSALRLAPEDTSMPVFRWRELTLVLGGVAAFAALVPVLGLILSAVLLLFIAATASHEFRLGETLVSIVVLVLLSYLVFVRGLGLQLPTWPTAFTGG